MRVFADTSFWVALIVFNDPYHSLAVQVMQTLQHTQIITSELVIVEALNFASGMGRETRETFVELADELLSPNLSTLCIRQNESLLHSALDLYRNRGDKQWSFVDCSSFTIMSDKRIQTALTTDHHFEQAGFTILLK